MVKATTDVFLLQYSNYQMQCCTVGSQLGPKSTCSQVTSFPGVRVKVWVSVRVTVRIRARVRVRMGHRA